MANISKMNKCHKPKHLMMPKDRLTEEQVDELLKKMTPEKARAFLMNAGLIDENGELTPPYRSTPVEPMSSREWLGIVGGMDYDGFPPG
jgi:hypothetical protein